MDEAYGEPMAVKRKSKKAKIRLQDICEHVATDRIMGYENSTGAPIVVCPKCEMPYVYRGDKKLYVSFK